MKKQIITLILLFLFIFVFGCIPKPKPVNQTILEKQALTTEEIAEIIMKRDKTEFDNLDYEEQKEIIEKGYFYTCYEVLGFCNKYPENPGCIKYCKKYIGLYP